MKFNISKCILLALSSLCLINNVYSNEDINDTLFEFDAGAIVRLGSYEQKSYRYGEGIITFFNPQGKNINTPVIVEVRDSRVSVNLANYGYSLGFSIPSEGSWEKYIVISPLSDD